MAEKNGQGLNPEICFGGHSLVGFEVFPWFRGLLRLRGLQCAAPGWHGAPLAAADGVVSPGPGAAAQPLTVGVLVGGRAKAESHSLSSWTLNTFADHVSGKQQAWCLCFTQEVGSSVAVCFTWAPFFWKERGYSKTRRQFALDGIPLGFDSGIYLVSSLQIPFCLKGSARVTGQLGLATAPCATYLCRKTNFGLMQERLALPIWFWRTAKAVRLEQKNTDAILFSHGRIIMPSFVEQAIQWAPKCHLGCRCRYWQHRSPLSSPR